jgi:PadR family transcriptional regulator, regulatory protein PadR
MKGIGLPPVQLPDDSRLGTAGRYHILPVLRFDRSGCRFLSKQKGNDVDLPQGTLDLLILKAIALQPQHGWAVSERIQQISKGALRVNQGSLYPALHRLERRGWIKAKWDVSDNNRRAKYYELTRKGHKQLGEQTDAWRSLTAAIDLLLDHS